MRNDVYVREHANITACRILLPKESDAVLVGVAVLAAVASGCYADILSAMAAMNAVGRVVAPSAALTAYHHAKYKVFHKLHEDQLSYRNLMSQCN